MIQNHVIIGNLGCSDEWSSVCFSGGNFEDFSKYQLSLHVTTHVFASITAGKIPKLISCETSCMISQLSFSYVSFSRTPMI